MHANIMHANLLHADGGKSIARNLPATETPGRESSAPRRRRVQHVIF